MACDSLGDFLRVLQDAGDLLRIAAPVDSAGEIAAITHRVCQSSGDGGPALFFENVRNCTFPVVTNLLGSSRRLCKAWDVATLDAAGDRVSEWLQPDLPGSWWETLKLMPNVAQRAQFSPRNVKIAACQQVVKVGRDVQLYELPAPQCWPQEVTPTLTAALVVTADPQTGVRDVSRVPIQIVDRQRVRIHWRPRQAAYQHAQAARSLRRQLPVAIVGGGDPRLLLAAAADWPGLPEPFWWAGVLRGASVDVAKCRTHDLEVPADVELVLEGLIDPEAEWEAADPLSLSTGQYATPASVPAAQVTAITHRANPVLPAIVPGPPPNEDAWIRRAIERQFLPAVRQRCPEVADLHAPASSGAQRVLFVSIRKTYPGQARQVQHALWGLRPFLAVKWIVVVDAEVNVQREADVWCAAALHADPERDLTVTVGPADLDDHASPQPGFGGKLGIDATRKMPAEGHSRVWPDPLRLSPELEQRLRERWAEYGLPLRWGEST